MASVTGQAEFATRAGMRWLAAATIAAAAGASLSGCSFFGEWDEPFAYQDVSIPAAVTAPGTELEYSETALLPLEDGREVALTFTQLAVGGPENAGLAEIGPEWTQPESLNMTVGVQGDADEGTSALPPDLVGVLDDGSVALRATEDEAPDATACGMLLGLPPQDRAHSRQVRCVIYLVPAGRALVELQWGPADGPPEYAENPVVWRVPSMDELMAGEMSASPPPSS
ncbi:hypothetical protein [Pseudoclavibacter helvolus]|uniref:hypothetical protein n=1 Tax=Pseudoclavibacter helvolus TaxID=255205 RepID=UPI003C7821F6